MTSLASMPFLKRMLWFKNPSVPEMIHDTPQRAVLDACRLFQRGDRPPRTVLALHHPTHHVRRPLLGPDEVSLQRRAVDGLEFNSWH
jgi:hypothetical protein